MWTTLSNLKHNEAPSRTARGFFYEKVGVRPQKTYKKHIPPIRSAGEWGVTDGSDCSLDRTSFLECRSDAESGVLGVPIHKTAVTRRSCFGFYQRNLVWLIIVRVFRFWVCRGYASVQSERFIAGTCGISGLY